MSPNIEHNPIYWRLKEQLYKLQGSQCPECQSKYYPPRELCTCGSEINPHPYKTGTVSAILEESDNNHRSILVEYENNGVTRTATFSLNGLSHSASIKIDMPSKILARKSSEQEEPILSLDTTSLISK